MNIMLVGGVSPMMNKLSLKLHKEGHKIFVLTGNRNPSEHYAYVFERYDFPYTSDSVKEVFRNVNPDVTIVLGAFDSNLYNENLRKQAVEYASGLQNILLSWSALNRGRLIYLSSVEVYGDSYYVPVTESVKPVPAGMRSVLLLQAEESCRFYQERLGRDVIILRIDRLYDVPKDKKEAALGICESMCLEAFRDETVTYRKNYSYGLTYMGDAVESIFKVITCARHQYGLYHISSGIEYSERQIADAINESAKNDVNQTDNTLEESHSIVLSNKRLKDEFGFDVRQTPEQIVQKTLKYMSKHSSHFLDDSHPGHSIWRRIYYRILHILGVWFPYIENLILFIPFFMLNNRTTDSLFFAKIDFYLVYVLLFAVVHGQRQATFSALLATAGYLFRQMYTKTGFQVVTDYNTYVWIAEIFIIGLVVGYLKDRLNFMKEEKEQETDFLTERVSDITVINDSNLRVKEGLISQVVNYDYSLGAVYEMINQLGEDHPIKILFRALTLVKQVSDCPDVSIYLVDGTTARLFGYTSEKSASLGHTVELPEKTPLYDAITKDIVFFNRTMDMDYPMMSYAVYENGAPDMMIMLWSVPFERMTIHESNRLIVLGRLIHKSAKRTKAYLDLLKDKRYTDSGRVLKAEAFGELVDAYCEAEKQNMTEYTLLKVLSVESVPQNAEEEAIEDAACGVAVGEETDGEEVVSEEAVGEETDGEEVVSEEAVSEETDGEETVGEEAVSEETISEEVDSEEVAGEEVVGEEVVGEEVDGEETAGEETVSEETVSEETVSEEVVGEEAVSEETDGEEVVGEEAVSEETVSEETVSEEVVSEETVSEEVVGEEAVSEETDGEEVVGEETDGEEVVDEETDGEEVVGEETDGEEVVGEETDGEEVVGEETDGEEVVSEEVVSEEAVGEETDGEEAVGEETDSEEVVGEEAVGEETDGEEVVSEEAVSEEAVSEETDSEEAVNEETDSEETDGKEVVGEAAVCDAVMREVILCEAVPTTEYIGYGDDGNLYILLAGIGKEEWDPFMSELAKKGIQTAVSKESQE